MGKGAFTAETQRHREEGRLKIFELASSSFSRHTRAQNKSLKTKVPLCLCVSAVMLFLLGCSHKPDPNTLVMVIESSPTNLDPRVGMDAQSERIDELIFDALVRRDEHFDLQPWLADRWETPDPLTYIFHLRRACASTMDSR